MPQLGGWLGWRCVRARHGTGPCWQTIAEYFSNAAKKPMMGTFSTCNVTSFCGHPSHHIPAQMLSQMCRTPLLGDLLCNMVYYYRVDIMLNYRLGVGTHTHNPICLASLQYLAILVLVHRPPWNFTSKLVGTYNICHVLIYSLEHPWFQGLSMS